MQFRVEFHMDNDEFQFPKGAMKAAIRRALQEVAGAVTVRNDRDLRLVGVGGKVKDVNGNTIGKWEIV